MTSPVPGTVAVWEASFLIDVFRPGSGDWPWRVEFEDLLLRDMQKVLALAADLARNGMTDPVLLGDDGRVWDGHHRILAALLSSTPVRTVQGPVEA